MSETCDCPVFFGIEYSDRTEQELGPVYDDFSHGRVKVDTVYLKHETLPNFIVPTCCNHKELDPLIYHPEIHFSGSALAWLCVFITIGVYWKYGQEQPLRFRGMRDVVLVGSITAGFSTALMLVVASDITYNCLELIMSLYFCLPLILMYYFVKSFQLAFIYGWQRAKKELDIPATRWYFDHLWVLNKNIYSMIVFGWVFVSIGWSLALYYGVRYYSEGENGSSLIRCRWWKIPMDYQLPNTDIGLCSCFRIALEVEPFGTITNGNTTLFLPATDEEEQAVCDSSSLSVAIGCLTANGTILAQEGVDEEFCELCVAGGQKSAGCEEYGTKMIATGACGYPDKFPKFLTCSSCLGADDHGVLSLSYLNYSLMLLDIIGLILIADKDDKYCVRLENIVGQCITLPFALMSTLIISFSEVDHFSDKASPAYVAMFIILYCIIFANILAPLLIPITVMFVWRHKKRSEAMKRFMNRKTNAKLDDNDDNGRIRVESGRSEPSETLFSDFSDQAYERTNVGELTAALQNEELGKIFSEFSSKEFTIENFLFLSIMYRILSPDNAVDLETLAKQARYVYQMYIEAESPMEVNLKAVNRKEVTKNVLGSQYEKQIRKGTSTGDLDQRSSFGTEISVNAAKLITALRPTVASLELGKGSGSVAANILFAANGVGSSRDLSLPPQVGQGEVIINGYILRVPESAQQVMEWFEPAIVEIRRLLSSDSWPRFQLSTEYETVRHHHHSTDLPQFRVLLESNVAYKLQEATFGLSDKVVVGNNEKEVPFVSMPQKSRTSGVANLVGTPVVAATTSQASSRLSKAVSTGKFSISVGKEGEMEISAFEQGHIMDAYKGPTESKNQSVALPSFMTLTKL